MAGVYARNGGMQYVTASNIQSRQVVMYSRATASGDNGGRVRASAIDERFVTTSARQNARPAMKPRSLSQRRPESMQPEERAASGEARATFVLKRKTQAPTAPALHTAHAAPSVYVTRNTWAVQRVSTSGGGDYYQAPLPVAPSVQSVPPPIPPKKPRARSIVYAQVQDTRQLPQQGSSVKTVLVSPNSMSLAPNAELLFDGSHDQKLFAKLVGGGLERNKQPDVVFVCRLKRPRDQQANERPLSVPTHTLPLSENATSLQAHEENPEVHPPLPEAPVMQAVEAVKNVKPEANPEVEPPPLEMVEVVKTNTAAAAAARARNKKILQEKLAVAKKQNKFVSRGCWAAGSACRDAQLQVSLLDTSREAEQSSGAWSSSAYVLLFTRACGMHSHASSALPEANASTNLDGAPASEKQLQTSYSSKIVSTLGNSTPQTSDQLEIADKSQSLLNATVKKGILKKSTAESSVKHTDSSYICRHLGPEVKTDAVISASSEIEFDSCGLLVISEEVDAASHPLDDIGIDKEPFHPTSQQVAEGQKASVRIERQNLGVQVIEFTVSSQWVQTEELRYSRYVLLQVGAPLGVNGGAADQTEGDTWPASFDVHSFVSTGQPTLIDDFDDLGFNWTLLYRRSKLTSEKNHQGTQTEPEPAPKPEPELEPEPEPEKEEDDEQERNSSSQQRMKFDIHEVLNPATARSEKQEFLDYSTALSRKIIDVDRGIYYSADGAIPIVQAVFTGIALINHLF